MRAANPIFTGVALLAALAGLAGCQSSNPGDQSAAPAVTTTDPGSVPPPADAPAVVVEVSAGKIVMRNGLVERSWTRNPFLTEHYTDLRNHKVWTQNTADFSLTIGVLPFSSDALAVSGDPVVVTTP